MVRAGSLCSGIEGIGIGLATHGIKTIWHCETDPAASKVLAHHYPDTPNYGDIKTIDWSKVERPDIVTAGFPCQDLSWAGLGAGIIEGKRSSLWRYCADAIGILRPNYCLIENVNALIVRGLDRVLADLAAMGFDAEWGCIRAADAGMPHRRERVFIAATHPERVESERRREPRELVNEEREK